MKKLGTTLLVLLSLSPSLGFAKGDKGGNGGGAEFCPQPKEGQLLIQAYDLWEGRDPVDPSLKREIPYYDGHSSKETYLNAAIEKIRRKGPGLAKAVERTLQQLNEKVQDKGKKRLELVSDANALYHDEGCQYLQLVNWIDSEEALKYHGLQSEVILRDEKSYKLLDPQNQAANDLHEALYKIRRAFELDDESGSVYVRRFVAQAFSTTEIDEDLFREISKFDRVVLDRAEFGIYLPERCGVKDIVKGTVQFINRNDSPVKLETGVGTFGIQKDKLEPGEASPEFKVVYVAYRGSGIVYLNAWSKEKDINLDARINVCGVKEESIPLPTEFLGRYIQRNFAVMQPPI